MFLSPQILKKNQTAAQNKADISAAIDSQSDLKHLFRCETKYQNKLFIQTMWNSDAIHSATVIRMPIING